MARVTYDDFGTYERVSPIADEFTDSITHTNKKVIPEHLTERLRV